MNWRMGQNFEAQSTRTMPRATSRGDGMTDTAKPGLGSSNGRSAWKEAGESGRRRSPEQTLEGSNPKRDAAFIGRERAGEESTNAEGAHPLDHKNALDRREGTASVAKRRPVSACAEQKLQASGGSSGGPSIELEPWGRMRCKGASLLGVEQALKGEPQERCDALGREHRQAGRGATRPRRRNAKGAKSRGWQPGAGTAMRAAMLSGSRPDASFCWRTLKGTGTP